ncbi:protein kinase domain-containing protein [Simkania sp.]|uniref:protein kinase domain-containing protein n=1 Tax=Simkania sp. TaxID=34094 RepID=UPI003B5161D2
MSLSSVFTPTSHATLHPQDGGYSEEGTTINRAVAVNVYSGPNDGPNGYVHNGPFPDINQFISPGFGRASLFNSFTRGYFENTTATWPQNVIHTIGHHFGRFSVEDLGGGYNSSAFVMQQEGSQVKHVLRTFSLAQLRDDQRQQSFQLNRNHVGGEWLSATFNHPNLAANTHIVVWDSLDNSFHVMDRNRVETMIANHHTLEEGRQIYAVATIGNYIEGSQDLEAYFAANPQRTEDQMRGTLHDVFEGVAAMNRQNTVHRDLKAANIIRLPDDRAQVIDFGTAATLPLGGNLPSFGGRSVHPYESLFPVGNTPRHTNAKTDSYSLFLLTYQAVSGRKFFTSSSSIEEIKRNQEEWHAKEQTKSFRELLEEDPQLAHVSPALRDLMAKLGTTNESRRLTAEQALAHEFFADRQVEQVEAA